MHYSITYQPQRNRNKPWLLKIWEPDPQVDRATNQEPGGQGNRRATYLFNARYWLCSRSEAQAIVVEFQQAHGVTLLPVQSGLSRSQPSQSSIAGTYLGAKSVTRQGNPSGWVGENAISAAVKVG